jgi:DnaK suppressor protein
VLTIWNEGKTMTTKEASTKAKSAESSKKASGSSAKGAPLTEAELLKMSEKDYMNAAQLEFFRTKLQTLKEDILKHASETTEHLRENILVPDPADRATIEEEHALELRTRDRERKLLKKVEQALARIDSGDYGWCEETGEAIGLSRLIARPTANLSLEAQERRELRQKLFGE